MINQHFIITHAQNREDIILSGFFKNIEKGFYVDVGANDPNDDSVTKYFYERGWNGINIEPIPKYYERLLYSRPRDINLNIAVADKEGEIIFREYHELPGLSTLSTAIRNEYEERVKKDKRFLNFTDNEIKVKSLNQVFKDNNVTDINFMKVDVEGFEYEVLSGNDWKKYRPEVICVEANHITMDWRALLERNDYKQTFYDGLNEYYVAEEFAKTKEPFSYVETMLPTPIVDYRVLDLIDRSKKEKARVDTINAELNNQIFELQHELYTTKESLYETTRLRGIIKALANKTNEIIEEVIVPKRYRGFDNPIHPDQPRERLIENGSPDEILNSIKEYDAGLRKLNPKEHRFRYTVLKLHRKFTLRAVRKSTSLAKKMLKEVNKWIKKKT